MFISRWDAAVAGKVPETLSNRLGIARCRPHLQGVPRPVEQPALPARVQSRRPTATAAMGQHRHEGSKASDILYIKALASPFTVNTMPEAS